MNVTYTINNYTVGAKLKTAPTHKLVKRERINSNHTVVTFEGLTANEKAFCDKLFGKTS